jgi:hypothetical protein
MFNAKRRNHDCPWSNQAWRRRAGRDVTPLFRRRGKRCVAPSIISRGAWAFASAPPQGYHRLTGTRAVFRHCPIGGDACAGLSASPGETSMILLATFLGLVIVGQAANVLIAMGVEQFSEPASLALFFVMFAAVFYVAWQLAVRITERRAKGLRG